MVSWLRFLRPWFTSASYLLIFMLIFGRPVCYCSHSEDAIKMVYESEVGMFVRASFILCLMYIRCVVCRLFIFLSFFSPSVCRIQFAGKFTSCMTFRGKRERDYFWRPNRRDEAGTSDEWRLKIYSERRWRPEMTGEHERARNYFSFSVAKKCVKSISISIYN